MKDPLGRLVSHELRGTMPPHPVGVALLIHGGGEKGFGPMPWWEGPVLRMRPFAKALEREAGDRLAVVRLKNRYHGWNGAEQTPLTDARWALDRIRDRYAGLPVALIGHSMGGRVVTHLAAEPGVTTVVGLAPWVEEGDPRLGRPGLRVLLMHGVKDRTTDPRRTQRLGEVLRSQGADVRWRPVEGAGHTMLRHASTWHREVAQFVASSLGAGQASR